MLVHDTKVALNLVYIYSRAGCDHTRVERPLLAYADIFWTVQYNMKPLDLFGAVKLRYTSYERRREDFFTNWCFFISVHHAI